MLAYRYNVCYLSCRALVEEAATRYFSLYVFVICFFFFQAEDGIRDSSVTGVQTCALPISRPRTSPRLLRRPRTSRHRRPSSKPARRAFPTPRRARPAAKGRDGRQPRRAAAPPKSPPFAQGAPRAPERDR